MEQEYSEEQQGVFSNKHTEESTDKNFNHTDEVTREVSASFDFMEKTWKTDFTLLVEDTRLHVSKTVLALASPVFDKMFQGDFKESDTDELELPGKRLEDVSDFLRWCYPSTMTKLSKEEALRVLPLADEYQVLHLKRKCEEILLGCINDFIPTEGPFRIMKAESLYDLKECLNRGVTVVSERSKEDIDAAAREIALPTKRLKEIYQSLSNRLAKRNQELESWNSRLTTQLITSETLKKYLSNNLNKSKLLKLDDELVWTGKTFLFKMDLTKEKSLEETLSICDVDLEIRVYYSYQMAFRDIYAHIGYNGENEIKCSLNVQIVVVNKMPTEQHFVVESTYNFRERNQDHTLSVAAVSAIKDPKLGFVYKGKIQLEVNILLSTPKQLETENHHPYMSD